MDRQNAPEQFDGRLQKRILVIVAVLLLGAAFLAWKFVGSDGPTRMFKRTLAEAESGDPDAQFLVARFYLEGRSGVPPDADKARQWYAAAYQQDHSDAAFMLGNMHRYGTGTKVDYQRAIDIYRDAVSLGNLAAENALGEMYYFGQGFEQNDQIALRHYRSPAEAGYAPAQRNMAILAFQGRGRDENAEEAYQWYIKAATQEDAIALNNLGIMFEHGQFVETDKERAHGCYFDALLAGYDKASKGLERLKNFAQPPVDEDRKRYVACVTGETYTILSRPRLRP